MTERGSPGLIDERDRAGDNEQVAKMRKVVTSDFIAFSGRVAHRRNATRRRLVKKHN